MVNQPVGPLQRELKLDMSNPISGLYMPLIDAAIAAAEDGVLEVRLREVVPQWSLSVVAHYGGGLYDRRKEARTDGNGASRQQWIWRHL